MWGAAAVYSGAILALAGLFLTVRPRRRPGAVSRTRGLQIAAAGALLAGAGLAGPAPESRVGRPASRLDEFVPVWQFREIHSLRIAAPPARVFEAIRQVHAEDILLFHTLTWIRRGGRPLSPGILNAAGHDPLIDVAIAGGFLRLADDPPQELVIGTSVIVPPGMRGMVTPELFRGPVPPGFALAAMNFRVVPDGSGSLVSTETRVHASGDSTRRRFAVYWRIIYPGSALIRRMWLRAIQERIGRGQP